MCVCVCVRACALIITVSILRRKAFVSGVLFDRMQRVFFILTQYLIFKTDVPAAILQSLHSSTLHHLVI